METMNFYPDQYKNDSQKDINHNYLTEQFSDYKEIFQKLESTIIKGDFTLGAVVDQFEKRYAEIVGTKYAIGVGSGTDALFLSLKALGIKEGDEVITTPYTFFATIGAIVTAGAKPVFADVDESYNINPANIEKAITPKTKAILPVHWSGIPCDMDAIMAIAKKHNLKVVEDSCHGIKAQYKGKGLGSFGDTGCFSMHPLKNLNVWGDGGVITTDNEELYKKLCLIRNHGLINRDETQYFSYNSRLDTIQAVVADHLLNKIDHITEKRIGNALYLDKGLASVNQITIPTREEHNKSVFHIYVLRAERRDELVEFLQGQGIDAKIHYPIPMHLQPAAAEWGHKKGDFPVAEMICDSVFSLPVHEFIEQEQLDFMIQKVEEFYK